MATIEIKNVGRLQKRLMNIANMDVLSAMNKATTLVHGQAKMRAPADTGNLRASISMKVTKNNNKIQGRVYTNVNYAPFVEFGTGIKGDGSYPYKVTGLNLTYKDKPWVYTPDGGETFYRTEGHVAQPYMYPALKENEKTIKAMFKNSVKAELKNNCQGG